MSAYEKLILNPVELTPELPEIDLSALGIDMGAAGPEFGESSVQVERIKTAIGEGVTSAHWPSIESTVPLVVGARPGTTMAGGFKPVEGFVSEVQRRSRGAIRREFADSAGFSGSVVTFVDAAGLTTPRGKDGVDEITLKLSRYPFWFATVETESEEFTASEVRELEFTLAEMLGTVPGLIKVVVKNNGSEDWWGCILSLECDDYSDAETAKPHYLAKDLTLQGGSEVVEDEDGAEVVKCPALTSGWVTVLSSEIEGVGHMTHVGTRRLAFRVEDPSERLDSDRLAEWVAGGEAGARPISSQANWKLEWRALGSAAWMQTQEGSTPIIRVSPIVGDYQLLDMGGFTVPTALTGDQRWEWRLQACVPSGSAIRPLIRDVYPLSTEQWMRVANANPDPIDGEPSSPPGTVEDATGVGTLTWANPGNAKTPDGSCATCQGSGEKANQSHYLKATNFGFDLPSWAIIRGIAFTVRRRSSLEAAAQVEDGHARVVKGGVVKEAIDHGLPEEVFWPRSFANAVYGGPSDLWGQTWTAADINSSTFGFAFSAWSTHLSAGSSHWYGKAEVDSISAAVTYAESANPEAHICVAERSLEFSDSGVRRQHPTDEVWGDLVEEGFLPYAPPAGQAGQAMRGLVIPSVGDFEGRADSAATTLSTKVIYRPAYLFAREAAE